VERLVEAQKKLATQYLADAKRLIASNDKKEQEEGFLALFRSHKALPKNKPLIKYLSEQGIKAGMLKTEEIYMEQNNKRMHEATDPLYFVIEEKLNSVDLTDKGVDLITGNSEDPTLFVLPDIAAQLSELENETNLTDEERLAKKDELLTNYAIKSERVHTINQLLKAYTMFEKDDEYVVIDGQVKIADRPYHGRSPLLRRSAPGYRSQGKRKSGSCHTDIRHHYVAELLPYVPQALGYDRYCRNGSRRTLGHLQTGCSGDSYQPPHCP
jgi:preprotein translocase subunit SecA